MNWIKKLFTQDNTQLADGSGADTNTTLADDTGQGQRGRVGRSDLHLTHVAQSSYSAYTILLWRSFT